ncbi:MAG: TIGR02281 family clan AA aspartic protease [Betaproteobacteria bacterium]|nr:TIGR02281 family clan AA aspartic protease [Betaproteobacteria bacterium]MDH3412198.1 TIGR02281 family clan AA aspartic protease [Gammaproteobacteria bacterium]
MIDERGVKSAESDDNFRSAIVDPRSVIRGSGGGAGMLLVGWLIIIGIVFWMFHGWSEHQANPNRALVSAPTGEVVLQRNRAGQYVADGEVNGERVTFLLDTGATQVALSTRLARELGLKRGPSVTLQTAAGPTRGYMVRLDSVQLAGIKMRDVGALVSDGLEPGLVLLGMNFLKRLEMIQRGDQLILKPMPHHSLQPPASRLPEAASEG